LGIGFAWWQLTQPQNASLIGLVTTIVAVASALAARSTVTPIRRQPGEAGRRPGTAAAIR
jgi:hypothetical protein